MVLDRAQGIRSWVLFFLSGRFGNHSLCRLAFLADDLLSWWYEDDALSSSYLDDWLSLWRIHMDEMKLQMQEAVFEMIFRRLFEIVTHSFVTFLLALYSVCKGLLVVFETSYWARNIGRLVDFVLFRWLIELLKFRGLVEFVIFRWLIEIVFGSLCAQRVSACTVHCMYSVIESQVTISKYLVSFQWNVAKAT